MDKYEWSRMSEQSEAHFRDLRRATVRARRALIGFVTSFNLFALETSEGYHGGKMDDVDDFTPSDN